MNKVSLGHHQEFSADFNQMNMDVLSQGTRNNQVQLGTISSNNQLNLLTMGTPQNETQFNSLQNNSNGLSPMLGGNNSNKNFLQIPKPR